jgi:hypothetical protein
VNATCATVSATTLEKLMNGITNGRYDDVLKEHNMYPLLVECIGNEGAIYPECIKSILWLKKDTASNEKPYLVYTRTQWKELSIKMPPESKQLEGVRLVKSGERIIKTLNIEEVCNSKTQVFTSDLSEILSEIGCGKHGEYSFSNGPHFKTCLCECLLPTLDLKQDLPMITHKNVKDTLMVLIGLYQKKQRSNKRTSDSQPRIVKKPKRQYSDSLAS